MKNNYEKYVISMDPVRIVDDNGRLIDNCRVKIKRESGEEIILQVGNFFYPYNLRYKKGEILLEGNFDPLESEKKTTIPLNEIESMIIIGGNLDDYSKSSWLPISPGKSYIFEDSAGNRVAEGDTVVIFTKEDSTTLHNIAYHSLYNPQAIRFNRRRQEFISGVILGTESLEVTTIPLNEINYIYKTLIDFQYR